MNNLLSMAQTLNWLVREFKRMQIRINKGITQTGEIRMTTETVVGNAANPHIHLGPGSGGVLDDYMLDTDLVEEVYYDFGVSFVGETFTPA